MELLIKRRGRNSLPFRGRQDGWAQEVLGVFRKVLRCEGNTDERKANAKFSNFTKIDWGTRH
jgi:hypothetical protein